MRQTLPILGALLFAAPLAAQLSGIYTINPTWPPSAVNYPSFAAATADLAAAGVSGPVTFLVYDDGGPFNETAPITPATLWAPHTAVVTFGSWAGTSSTNRVTFAAAPGEAPVLDATGRAIGIYWSGADYVTIDGLDIRNAPFDAVSLYSDSTHGVPFDPIIRRCKIHDCGGSGISVYGNSSYPVNTLIENNFFWSLMTQTNGSFYPTGRFAYVTSRRSTNTRVVHNTFFVNTGAGTQFAVIGAYPSSATETPFAEVSNNLVFKAAAAGQPTLRILAVSATSVQTPPVCESNCFFDSTTSPFALYGSGGATTAATLLDWQIATGRDLTSLVADPLLQATWTYDLRLSAASPCIGASTVAAGVVDDIDGQPRTVSVDLGADEYSTATMAEVGAGCAGSNGTPSLGALSSPFLGNPNWALYAANLPPGAPMFTAVSFGTTTSPTPVGGTCNVWLPLSFLTALPVIAVAGPAGTTSVLFSWPANPAYAGVNYGFQALVVDPGTSLGFTLSNALDVVLGM